MDSSPVIEAEGPFDLVVCGSLAHFQHIRTKSSRGPARDEFGIDEDEGLLDIEPHRNDVHRVLQGEPTCFIETELRTMQKFLIIGQHNHQRNVEDILQISVGIQ